MKKRSFSLKSTVIFGGIWCGASVGLLVCVRLLIFSVGDLVRLFDETFGVVFFAWKNADVNLPIGLLVFCGGIIAALLVFCFTCNGKENRKGNALVRVIGILAAILLFCVSFFLVLWKTEINAVPVSELVGIIADLAGAL